MIIENIYMARKKAESWKKADWSTLFALITLIMMFIIGGNVIWALNIFTACSNAEIAFWGLLSSTGTFIAFIGRWSWYVNKDRNNKIIGYKVVKPKKPVKTKLSKSEEALNFIKDCRK